MIKVIALAGGIGLLSGAVGGGYFTYSFVTARWEAATERLKSESAVLLQQSTEKAMRIERVYAANARKRDIEHAKSQKLLNEQTVETRRLVYAAGGLFDPGCGQGGSNDVPGTPGSTSRPAGCPAPTRLSNKTTEFLLDFAAEADTAANFARTCYLDAVSRAKSLSEGN